MASKYYIRTGYTGGGAGTLDSIDGDDLTASAKATVITDKYTSHYSAVATSAVEATPNVIRPDTNGTDFKWMLNGMHSNVLVQYNTSEPASPLSGRSVIWLSNGVGVGDAGDLMVKITVNATTSVSTLVDFSSL